MKSLIFFVASLIISGNAFCSYSGSSDIIFGKSYSNLSNAPTIPKNVPGPEAYVLMDSVKKMAEALIASGFNAGEGYGEVWIRDFNTFMEVACKVNNPSMIKKHLLTFFQFQQGDGQIIDGYIPKQKSDVGYKYYYSALAPEFAGHKNTVETDQESSLVQAVYIYITKTGDTGILNEVVDGISVQKRLELAMKFLLNSRFEKKYGLIWGATTADWGDVQPEHQWGVELDSSSHKAIDIYDNAMFVIAVKDYLAVSNLQAADRSYWENTLRSLKKNIREYLWDTKANKFIPHIYLNGSPFPSSFKEDEIYYHGGTAVAIEADILTKAEVKSAYMAMQENVRKIGAATIGLTLYPAYPDGYFKNTGMKAYSYQNGGDWTWFGGRMVTQLIRFGYKEEAWDALKPMLERVVNNKGFYEWYTVKNEPKGSAKFRGEAGVLWTAINQLENINK